MLAYDCDMDIRLTEPANDDFRPTPGDAVAAYFATRGWRRLLTAGVSCLAMLILTLTLAHGVQASRPLPEHANVSSSD
jgi:hypothetical protein